MVEGDPLPARSNMWRSVGCALGVGTLGGCCLLGVQYMSRVRTARRRLYDLIANIAGADARVVITGATSGIGEELARQFLRHPSVSVILGCRDVARAQRLFCKPAGAQQKAKILHLDLLDLDSTQAFAEETHGFLLGGESGLRLIVNNAGVMKPPTSRVASGADPSWQTHFLGPYLFIELLARHRAMESTVKSMPLRVVQVSSRLEKHSKLDDAFFDEVACGRPGVHTYADSKRALMLWTSLRAQSLAFKSGIYVHAATPGMVDTQLGRHSVHPWLWPFTKPLRMLFLRSPAEGALAVACVGLRDEATDCFGRYFDGNVELEDLVVQRMGEKNLAQKVTRWASQTTALEARIEGYDK
eukprot:TRINITY_DN7422_c0_g1_i1.p1 TRINITY_DN7422_c0_g1~~TRINITY_DN7422_c0_g1_i1.p1  ORF type:complete len:357 (+),score=43.61 TRINITY_DN7422_c0_g1_i1:76-1146(+)